MSRPPRRDYRRPQEGRNHPCMLAIESEPEGRSGRDRGPDARPVERDGGATPPADRRRPRERPSTRPPRSRSPRAIRTRGRRTPHRRSGRRVASPNVSTPIRLAGRMTGLRISRRTVVAATEPRVRGLRRSSGRRGPIPSGRPGVYLARRRPSSTGPPRAEPRLTPLRGAGSPGRDRTARSRACKGPRRREPARRSSAASCRRGRAPLRHGSSGKRTRRPSRCGGTAARPS